MESIFHFHRKADSQLRGSSWGYFSESNRFAFSPRLLSVEWYGPIRLKDEENGSRRTDFNGSPVELALEPRPICSWLGGDRPADRGGLLPGVGETGYRLVADTRFLSRISGALVRRISCVGEERDPAQHKSHSFLGWNCRDGSGTGRIGPGRLRVRSLSLADFATHFARRTGSLLWRTAVLEGAAFPLAGPVAGHSASCHHLQPDHLSAANPGFQACQRAASFIRRAGSAGRQCHRTSLDEAGGG